MRKTAVVVASAAFAAGAVAGAAPASASTTTHLRVTAVRTSHVDYPNHDFTETDALWRGGHRVGEDLVYCTFARTQFDCAVGVSLQGGVLAGQFVLHPKKAGFHGTFVQGTGAFSGTTGTFTGTFRPHNRIALTFNLHS